MTKITAPSQLDLNAAYCCANCLSSRLQTIVEPAKPSLFLERAIGLADVYAE